METLTANAGKNREVIDDRRRDNRDPAAAFARGAFVLLSNRDVRSALSSARRFLRGRRAVTLLALAAAGVLLLRVWSRR